MTFAGVATMHGQSTQTEGFADMWNGVPYKNTEILSTRNAHVRNFGLDSAREFR